MPIECRAMCFFFFTKFHTRHNKPQNIQRKHTKKYITYTPSLTRHFALLLLLCIIPGFTMLLLACIAVCVCVLCVRVSVRCSFIALIYSVFSAFFTPCVFVFYDSRGAIKWRIWHCPVSFALHVSTYVCVGVCVLLLIMLLSKLAAALIHTNNAKSIWRASQ